MLLELVNALNRTKSISAMYCCQFTGKYAFAYKKAWLKWAIPDIRCIPPKEDKGIPKILTTFFIGKSQKIKHFFGC